MTLLAIERDAWMLSNFKACLGVFKEAKASDPQAAYRACAEWLANTVQATSKYWSLLHQERDRSVLELDDFLFECLTTLGGIIEACAKPYIQVMLHHVRIGLGEPVTKESLEALDLGRVVDDLIEKSSCPQLFMPPPWGIKLSQWRNIAYHHTASIENGEVVCSYGKPPKTDTVRLSKEGLLEVVTAANNIYGVLRLAYVLFFSDNRKEINPLLPRGIDKIEVTDEADFVNFAAGLMALGFEVTEYRRTSLAAVMTVRDLTGMNASDRAAHSSQFLYRLWMITRAKAVTVTYQTKDETPALRFRIDGETCEKVWNGQLNDIEIASLMEVNILLVR